MTHFFISYICWMFNIALIFFRPLLFSMILTSLTRISINLEKRIIASIKTFYFYLNPSVYLKIKLKFYAGKLLKSELTNYGGLFPEISLRWYNELASILCSFDVAHIPLLDISLIKILIFSFNNLTLCFSYCSRHTKLRKHHVWQKL